MSENQTGNTGLPTVAWALMLGAFLCFAIMDTSVKWLVLAAIPALQVAFLRYFVHLLWVVVWYVPSQGTSIVRSNKPAHQLLRGFLLFMATTLNFIALKYLPLTTTIAIFFAAPMLVCLLSIPILKEKVGIKRFIAVAVGFIGVLIIVHPGSQPFDKNMFFSIGALIMASGYFVMSRMVAGADSNAVMQFYTAGIATVALAPIAIMRWEWPATMLEWTLLIGVGSLGMLGHSMLVKAHQLADASILAPIVYSQIIYIAILSWWVFGTTPDIQTILGVLVIVASGLYIWHRERHIEQRVFHAPDAQSATQTKKLT